MIDSYPHFRLISKIHNDEVGGEKFIGSYVNDLLSINTVNFDDIASTQPLTLKQFFITQTIDTPLFLKQSNTKFRPLFKFPKDSLIGMLARHGKRTRVDLFFLLSYTQIARQFFFPRSDEVDKLESLTTMKFMLSQPIDFYSDFDFNFDEISQKKKDNEDPLLPSDEKPTLRYQHHVLPHVL